MAFGGALAFAIQVDALVECLRDFVQFNYMTAAEVARQICVHDSTCTRGF